LIRYTYLRIFSQHTHICQIFRDEDGVPNLDPGAGLHLRLEDFATEALVETYEDLEGHIFIPSNALCAYLDRAENRESTIKQERGVVKPLKSNVRKRRRQSTPPEELQSDRETRFLQDEHKASQRSMRDDLSYVASSTSGADST
jgi:hypothetical protein